MMNSRDFFTHTVNVPLSDSLGAIGTSIIKYEIRRYRDVRNLEDSLAYQVKCSQRIIIPNAKPYPLGAQNITSFSNYPAILSNSIKLTDSGGSQAELMDYFPRTINTAITTSHTNAQGDMSSTSHQHSTGSSTSQSNTFGATASVGFFGDALTGGVSVSDSHTSGSSHSTSTSSGNDSGTTTNSSGGETMSVKDWACNAYLDTEDASPTWVWGQQYPWDVVKYNNAGVSNPTEASPIVLPSFMIPLLCDDTQALPPSQLSLFGIDFTMESVWIIKPDADCEITFDHNMSYFSASHSFVAPANGNSASVNAYISNPRNPDIPSVTIDLSSYGLEPLGNPNGKGGAIVGFVPNKFLVKPAPVAESGSTYQATKFKTISGNNNLLITDSSDYSKATSQDVGAGFSATDTALLAKFTENCSNLSMTINFKISDTSEDYILHMKHWKTGQTGVMLNMEINDNSSTSITKYIDTYEAEGGENNVLSIALRDLDYGSVDYHDYLNLGFNKVVISIAPIGGSANAGDCGYGLRAIAIANE